MKAAVLREVKKPLLIEDVQIGKPGPRDCLRVAGVVSLLYGVYCITLPHTPLPPLTMNVLNLIPDIFSAGGILLGGIYWLTHRKLAVARAEKPASQVSRASDAVEKLTTNGRKH